MANAIKWFFQFSALSAQRDRWLTLGQGFECGCVRYAMSINDDFGLGVQR